MNRIHRLAIAALLSIAPVIAHAQTQPVKALFLSMPSEIAPLLTANAKLDMIDYFESDMDTPTANVFDGKMRILELTPEHLAAELGLAQKFDLYLLPSGADTLALYISTINLPKPDSYIYIVDAEGSDISQRLFRAPTFGDWLSPQGKKQRNVVEGELQYVTSTASYSPTTQVLTLTLGYPATLSREVRVKLEPLTLKQLTYKWNGKNFIPVK